MKFILLSLFCTLTLLLLTLEIRSHVIKRDISAVPRADKSMKADTTDKKNSSKEKKEKETAQAAQDSVGIGSGKPFKENAIQLKGTEKKGNKNDTLSPSNLGVTQKGDKINKNNSSKEKNKKENGQAAQKSLGKDSVKPEKAKITKLKSSEKKEGNENFDNDKISPSVLCVTQKYDKINQQNTSKEINKTVEAAHESFGKDSVKPVKENKIQKGAEKKGSKGDSLSPSNLGVTQKDNQINKKNSSKEKNKKDNAQAAQESLGNDSVKPDKEKVLQLKNAEKKSRYGAAQEGDLKRDLLVSPGIQLMEDTTAEPQNPERNTAQAGSHCDAKCSVNATNGKRESSLVINIHQVDINSDIIKWET